MKINLIGVPLNLGADKLGSNLAPKTYREANITKIIKSIGFDVKDCGDVEVLKATEEEKYKHHPNLKYLNEVVDANTKLAEKVYKSLSNGDFALVLGGDHSLGLGSIAGASKAIKNIGVVWIDAHGDINTHLTSPTGNIHGMPLAASFGVGHEALVNLYEDKVKVKEENVFHIAGRDLDKGEIELINRSKGQFYTMDKVKELGIEKVVEDMLNYFKDRVDAIHVSFDLDSIDSLFAPGTGTPVEDGLSVDDAKYILESLASSGMMCSLDIVELNPLLDKNNKTLNIAIDIIKNTLNKLKLSLSNELSA
ncbi:MAG: arginase [Caloramator sp.]|jgi:arginase|uniref:arginase n=1 Tax=Caloramator sp. TaxID=1871330 RepID=UPI001DDD2B24|nr:arginase [Caloramator sp.]MBZ4662605.1 arginase [Caloramator sp.]